MEQNTIICFVGVSGSGKTTLASLVSTILGIPVVCSYTTRPMREGEIDGIDHHFITETEGETMVNQHDLFAFTCFNNYMYFTTKDQVKNTCIYVIDENGINNLPDEVKTMIVYIDADERIRRMRGVSEERILRDNSRDPLQRPINVVYLNNENNIVAAGKELSKTIHRKLKYGI